MSRCFGCDYYDASVDCCNGDDVCYADGYEDGYQKAIEMCIDKIKSYSNDDKLIKLIGGNTKTIVGIVFDNSIPIHDRALGRMAKNKLIEELVEQLEQLKERR